MTTNSQVGVKDGSTWGTAVTVDRFYQFTDLSFTPRQARFDGEGLRSSRFIERSDQVRVHPQGGEFDLEVEWMTKGMGWLLKHLMGVTGTTGPTDSAYVHSGTIGSLYGDFFTFQGNFPLHPAGTDQALTADSCKFPEWELSCDVDGKLMLKAKVDARSVTTATGLASASYASAAVPYEWVDVSATLGGTAIPLHSWSIKCNNNLDVDRYLQQGSALKLEPTAKGRPAITVDFETDFSALATVYNRVRGANAAAAIAAFVVTATVADTGVTIGAATQPSTVITIPALRLDETSVKKSAPGEGTRSPASGVVRDDGSNSPMTIAYTSADSTA